MVAPQGPLGWQKPKPPIFASVVCAHLTRLLPGKTPAIGNINALAKNRRFRCTFAVTSISRKASREGGISFHYQLVLSDRHKAQSQWWDGVPVSISASRMVCFDYHLAQLLNGSGQLRSHDLPVPRGYFFSLTLQCFVGEEIGFVRHK